MRRSGTAPCQPHKLKIAGSTPVSAIRIRMVYNMDKVDTFHKNTEAEYVTQSHFSKMNDKARESGARELRITNTVPGNATGGHFVYYDDFGLNMSDMASLNNIIMWVYLKEAYVDNEYAIMALLKHK